MNKKWRKTSLALVGVALVANPLTLNYLGFSSNANDVYYSFDNDLYDTQLNEATDIVKKAKETKTEEDVKKAIDSLITLPYPNDYKLEEKNKLLDELFYFIDNMENANDKVNYGLYFVEASINRVTESLIQPDYELTFALIYELPDGAIKDKYMTILEKIDKTMGQNLLEQFKNDPQGIPTQGFDWSRLPSDVFAPYVDVDTGEYLPGYPLKNNDKVDKPNPEALPEKDYSSDIRYETSRGQCYKVTEKTIEGNNRAITTRELVTGTDATMCQILVMDSRGGRSNIEDEPYDFSRVRPAPSGSGDNIQSGQRSSSSYATGSYNSNANGQENEVTGLTLQYTLDKTEEKPYFYETDMLVSKDGTITYQQQRDVLFQLAIRSGGKAVEDKDRFLVLIENKIIVVENKGDKIPVSAFDSILKDFKAQVKAMDTIVGQ